MSNILISDYFKKRNLDEIKHILISELNFCHNQIKLNSSTYNYSNDNKNASERWYIEAIDKIENIKGYREGILCIKEYFSKYIDPHTSVMTILEDEFYATGIIISRYDGNYFVSALKESTNNLDVVKLGDRLTHIDGVCVNDILEKDIINYMSVSSNSSALSNNAYKLFFRNDINHEQALKCRLVGANGVYSLMLKWEKVENRLNYLSSIFDFYKMPVYEKSKANFGHIITLRSLAANTNEKLNLINSFVTDSLHLSRDKHTVLDLRGNVGGSSEWAKKWVINYFDLNEKKDEVWKNETCMAYCSIENCEYWESILTSMLTTNSYGCETVEFKAWVEETKKNINGFYNYNRKVFNVAELSLEKRLRERKLIVITNSKTFSSAEIFVDMLKKFPNVIHVGVPTDASTMFSDIRRVKSSGGIFEITFPTKVYTANIKMSGRSQKPDIRVDYIAELESKGVDSIMMQVNDLIAESKIVTTK